MTLLAISFHSTHMKVIRAIWQQAQRHIRQDLPAISAQPIMRQGTEFYTGGTFVLFHWEKNQVIWQIDIDGPTGFCLWRDALYIAMMRLGDIVVLNGYGQEVHRFSHRALNNLHTITPTNRGFLVTNSGLDALCELDSRGNMLYEWSALDHGYPSLPGGQVRTIDYSLDQRYIFYATAGHTTHINSACFADPEERTILATLFHQGTIIAIDRLGSDTQTLLGGLKSPHDLRRYPHGGWIVSDTGHHQALILNDHWEVTHTITGDFDWVQSSAPLRDGSVIIADTNHHRLVRVYPNEHHYREIRAFPPDWRIFLVQEITAEESDFFRYPIAPSLP